MNRKQKQLLKKITERNTGEYNLIKAIEELNELSCVLSQYIVKPAKVQTKDITDEIGDVMLRLPALSTMFGKKEVKKRVADKLTAYEQYFNDNKYPNI